MHNRKLTFIVFILVLMAIVVFVQAAAPHVKLRGGGAVPAGRKAFVKIRGGGTTGSGGGASWSNGYAYRRTIIASSSLIAPSGTALSNFPMLVSSTLADMATAGNGGKIQNSSGYDVIFTSDAAGSTKLNWETEKYVSSTGEMDQWVQVPTLSSSSANTVYMFYDKAGVNSFQSVATATWDGNYKGVWHQAENAANSNVKDSTGNQDGIATNFNSATPQNTNIVATTGQIDGAFNYRTANYDWVDLGVNSADSLTNNFTVSVWVEGNDFTGVYGLLTHQNAGGDGWGLVTTGDSKISFSSFVGGAYYISTNSAVSTGSWHYLVGVINSGTRYIYLDGVQQTLTDTNLPAANTTVHGAIGKFYGDADSAWFRQGILDEARISGSVRSADWIKTEYNNQNSPSIFMSIGAATANAGSSVSASVKFR